MHKNTFLSCRVGNLGFTLAEGATHVDTYNCKFNNGFTLAEVLITLGVIGVVAAITLPTLISSHNNHIAETRLKKFYSVMNQAILQSKNDNGDPKYWNDYWVGDIEDDNGEIINQVDKIDVAFEKYLAPYLKIVEKRTVTDYKNQKRILYYLADGSAFTYAVHENRDISFYPKNAEKCVLLAPDKSNSLCRFTFEFYPLYNGAKWKFHYNKGMEPIMYNWDGDIRTLYDDPVRGCVEFDYYCTAIIQQNGWKVPKDFPRKIKF